MNELRAKDYALVASPPSAAPPAEADRPQQTTNILAVVWRRKWLIAAIMVFAVALAVYWTKSVTPLFTAQATLKLDVYQPGIVDIDSVVTGVTGDVREIRSQLQVIRSRSLMGRVVDAMDLTRDPEFNPLLIPAPEPTRFSLGGLMRLIAGGSADEPAPAVPVAEIRERAIDALLARVNVLPVHFSFVFSVSVTTEAPQKSATIANTIAEQYILNQIEVKYDATEQATNWLSNRVTELKDELEIAEEAVAAHQAQNEGLTEEAAELVSQRLASLRTTQAEAEQSRDKSAARLADLERLIAAERLAEAAALTGSIRLERLARTIAENGGAAAPESAELVERFRLELDAVLARLAREVSQSQSSLASLGTQIVELEARQLAQGEAIVVLRQLEREAQAASLIYETFLSRLKETSVQQGVHKADALVISEARVPKSRSFPRMRMALAAALLLGAVLAAAVVAILEMLDQTFSTPEDLEKFTGLPVLGLIPAAPLAARANVLKYFAEKPTSIFVESVRNLRTSIQLSGVDGDVQVVAMCSAGENEGKTMMSMALAHSSATQQNRRVLVMDCDLRRRRLTADLGGRGLPGLIAYFGGSKTIDEIIHPHETGEFDVIFADKSPKITADIFASQKFAALMADLRTRYDMIIVDTPPVLALTDVKVLAHFVDLMLFSVSWKRTRRRLVRTALSALALAKPKRVAVVFNRMNIAKSIGYYGSYYYNNR